MATTLGLDIGTNSVGWALVTHDGAGIATGLIAMGVRVFPEGVDRDQTGSEIPNLDFGPT